MKKLLFIAMALLPAAALAHEGDHSLLNFAAGFWHPLNGLDHLLALVATGMWLLQTDTRPKWLVTAAFVAILGIAIPVGMQFAHLTFEAGIVATLVVLGALMAAAVRGPLLLRAIVLLATAAVHGFVHGTELSGGEGVLAFSLALVGSSLTVVVLAAVAGACTHSAVRNLIARLLGVGAIIAGVVLSM